VPEIEHCLSNLKRVNERVSVPECERVQKNWFLALASQTLFDGPLSWTMQVDGVHLMFPKQLTIAGVRRGIDFAHANRAPLVGVWLGLEVDAAPLATAGFERGWSPWWMAARKAPHCPTPHITVEPFGSVRPWRAVATVGVQEVGHATAFRDGDLAGIFDMEVRSEYRRRGLGSELLSAVFTTADASAFVLNATPKGKRLYERSGFVQIGEGITWWLHLESGR